MTSQHTTSPSGTAASEGSRPAELVHTSSNANFFKLVTLQLRSWALLILLAWPVFVWIQFWTNNAGSPEGFPLFFLFMAAVVLGIFPSYFGWEANQLRALSLSSRDIRKTLLTVKVCGVLLAHSVLWLSVWFWFPLSSMQGIVLVAITLSLNLMSLVFNFRDTQPWRTEVMQDSKIESKANGDDQILYEATATELLIDQPLNSILRWTAAIGAGAFVIGSIILLIAKDPSVKGWVIALAMYVTVAIGFVGSMLNDILRNWLTFSGSRATWFQRVAKKTAVFIPVGIFIYTALFVGLYAVYKPTVPTDVNIVGSTILGIGLLVLGMGIVAGAIMWSIVMLMTGLSAHVDTSGPETWKSITTYIGVIGTQASLLSALGVWWLQVLGFGGVDLAESHPEVQTLLVVLLGVTAIALLLGWTVSKALVMRADVRATGLTGFLGLKQEVQQ